MLPTFPPLIQVSQLYNPHDRGEGIPLEFRERIFDRFFRVKEGAGARRPGTGLGLYIARTLVEAMSGRIWVYSKEGVGTTFSFSLPVVDVARLDGVARGDLPMHEEAPLPLVRSG